jgi:nicotinamidase-related amidase
MSGAVRSGAEGGADLARRSAPFLDYLEAFVAGLPERRLADVIEQAGGPDRVAIILVDVVNGFCRFGALASERVGAIVPPIVELLRAAYDAGVSRVAVFRDSHTPNALEFEQFAPHCVAGTPESALVDEVAGLPQAAGYYDVPKNSISPWLGHDDFVDWANEQEASGVNTFIVVGDCTDLCVYQTAMPFKLRGNQVDRRVTVIVPARAVDTYDLPVEVARGLGAMPHDGDLLHAVFLYHLQLNGVQVVRELVFRGG